jgi:hypothetical protein
MIISLIVMCALLLASSYVGCAKPGKNEDIAKYDNIEE